MSLLLSSSYPRHFKTLRSVQTIWLDCHSVNIPRCSWPFEQDQYTSIHVKVSCVELEIANAFAFSLKKVMLLFNLYTLVGRSMPSIGSFCVRLVYTHVQCSIIAMVTL